VAGTSRVRQTPSQTGGALVDALWPQRAEGLATEVGSSAPPPASVAPTSRPSAATSPATGGPRQGQAGRAMAGRGMAGQ